MCGFFGAISDKEDLDSNLIFSASKKLSHRGPDDFGYFLKRGNSAISSKNYNKCGKSIPVNFANNKKFNTIFFFYRLSIFDLTNLGHQPFFENDRYIMNFNGAIYNYIELKEYLEKFKLNFKSKTDTEVLYHLLIKENVNCLNKLNGMFAISFFDRTRNKLFLIRDRYGVKPLYYSIINNKIFFSSEIKPLLELNSNSKKINNDVFFSFLTDDNIANLEKTPYQNIYQIKSGSYLEVSYVNNSLKTKKVRWYRPNLNKKEINFEDAKEKFYHYLKNSVDIRMRSDTKLGIFLSGGLDSSLVSILASKNRFIETISFNSELKQFDEKNFIYEVLKKNTNLSNKSFIFSEQNYADHISAAVESQEIPFYNSSTVTEYLLYKKASELGNKVMLDGHGADEMLLGYEYLKFAKIGIDIRKGDFNLISKILKGLFNRISKTTFYNLFRLIKAIKNKISEEELNILTQELFFESNLPKQLTMVDRSSMSHGVENRSPFLDYRVVELIFSLPLNYLVNTNTSKYILREAFKSMYPKEIYHRKTKVGYSLEELKFKNIFNKNFYKDNFSFMKNNIPHDVIKKINDKKISENEKVFLKNTISIWVKKLNLRF